MGSKTGAGGGVSGSGREGVRVERRTLKWGYGTLGHGGRVECAEQWGKERMRDQ